MAEKPAIRNLLDRIYREETVTPDEANAADKELCNRLSFLDTDNKRKFERGKVKAIIQNVLERKNSQLARAKLTDAFNEYSDLQRLASDYNQVTRNNAGQATYAQIHGSAGQRNKNGYPKEPPRQISNSASNGSTQNEQRYQNPTKNTTNREHERGVDDISKQASYNMKKSNPNIADLSDTNRPTKIAERYSELYDNEWTEAFEDLTKQCRFSDEQCIQLLYKIITEAYTFALETSDGQIKRLFTSFIEIMLQGRAQTEQRAMKPASQEDITLLRQLRKGMVTEGIPNDVQKLFIDEHLPKITKDPRFRGKDLLTLKTYATKCIDITWWMCVQDPPVQMCDIGVDHATVDGSRYRAYTRSGNKVDYVVWPCVILCEGGPILCKGVAQFK